MKKFRTRLTTVVVLLGACANAAALGLGEARSTALIGRPLEVTVPVRAEPGDEFSSECVNAEVQFGDTPLPSSSLRLRVTPGSGPGEWRLHLSTVVPVAEPIVNVSVSAGCTGRVSRSYVTFADPPAVRASLPETEPQAIASSPAPAPRRAAARRAADAARDPGKVEVAAAPTPAASPVPRASEPRSAPAATPRAPRNRRPASAAPADPATARAPTPERARSRTAEPRLRLDPLEAVPSSGPALRSSDELASGTAPAAEAQRRAAETTWQALNATPDQIVAERERMRQLERQLVQLREESAQTRRSLDTLRAQLQRAEQERDGSPLLVYLLVGVCLLLGVGLIWALRWRHRGGPRIWWRPSEVAPAHSRHGPLPDDDDLDLDADEAPPPVRAKTLGERFESTGAEAKPFLVATPGVPPVAATEVALPVLEPIAEPAPLRAPAPTPGAVAKADALVSQPTVSVEELIDLEQQAEFFVALGQEEAAVDLLLGHVSGHPDGSPLPYLKLLEIHQRRGDREAYERIRGQFNDRFNAYAPAWEDALSDGRSLEDYPTVVSRLQALWETPSRALDVLQASLLRKDRASQTFDLPAYRELLMLYSVARDRVEAEADAAGVDLLLPLDEEVEGFSHTMLEPLVATTPVRPYDGPEPANEVDLPLEFKARGREPVAAEAPSAGEPAPSNFIEFEPIQLDLPEDTRRAGGKSGRDPRG
ncbi:hypothetical protein OOT46_08360 [Aquabacterium sp. A7-Y]|uniref:type IV pilus assembly protein FimV n=1 Tax=Aquabacterium sp. A7-Y TaxID=1349605 RepID=UPI00223E60FB|nr:hypothetical protein [Aquabacterium sp. A7-Y]MCW7537859.1 hypothetical protein [Aquabacterium sp. A7-Y]